MEQQQTSPEIEQSQNSPKILTKCLKTKTYTYTRNGKTRTITRTFEVAPKRYSREQIDNYINANKNRIKSIPLKVAYDEFKDSTKINMSFSWFYNNIRRKAIAQ